MIAEGCTKKRANNLCANGVRATEYPPSGALHKQKCMTCHTSLEGAQPNLVAHAAWVTPPRQDDNPTASLPNGLAHVQTPDDKSKRRRGRVARRRCIPPKLTTMMAPRATSVVERCCHSKSRGGSPRIQRQHPGACPMPKEQPSATCTRKPEILLTRRRCQPLRLGHSKCPVPPPGRASKD